MWRQSSLLWGALFFVKGGIAKMDRFVVAMDISDLQWIYEFYDGYIVFTMDKCPFTMDISFLQWKSPNPATTVSQEP